MYHQSKKKEKMEIVQKLEIFETLILYTKLYTAKVFGSKTERKKITSRHNFRKHGYGIHDPIWEVNVMRRKCYLHPSIV